MQQPDGTIHQVFGKAEKATAEAQGERELPRYLCHKEVWALKIAKVESAHKVGKTGALLTPIEEGYQPFVVSPYYVAKHQPQVGGYYVLYEDGYESWSPPEAFESGYTKIT